MKKSLFIAAFLFGGFLAASAQNTTGTTKSCCMKDANTKTTCCSKGTTGTSEVKSCHGHTSSNAGTQDTKTTSTQNGNTSATINKTRKSGTKNNR